MGLASGGGGRGGGGGSTFIWFGGRGSSDLDPKAAIAAIITGVVVVGGIITFVVLSNNETKKLILEERNQLEEKLAQDTNVEKFNLEFFDWLAENNKYFFTFTGTALKEEGKPIDFIFSKYQVSQQSYYEIITHIEKEEIEGLDHKTGLLSKILEIVNQSELVESNQVDKLSNAVFNKESGDMVSIKGIKVPLINKENNTISYEVELMKFNNEKIENSEMVFETKSVTMPLTDKLERYPTLAYFADKEQCKVETVEVSRIKLDGVLNYIPIYPEASQTLKNTPNVQQLNAEVEQGPELTPKMSPTVK